MVRKALRTLNLPVFDNLSEEEFKKLKLIDDLRLDSLDLTELIFCLERDNELLFPQKGLDQCQTVGDLMKIAEPN